MIRFLPFALLAALLAAPDVRAAETKTQEPVYKIVGPDGRVTFSDRVSTNSDARTSVVTHEAASQPVVMLPPITAIMPWQSLSVDARRGIVPAIPLGLTADSPGVITVELVDALSMALARAEIVQAMRDQCVRTRPGVSGGYDEAVRHWREHNAGVVDRANAVLLASFDPPRRAKVQANAHTRLMSLLAPLASASAEAKAQWCDQSAELFQHGGFDMDVPSPIGKTLKNFVIQ